MEEVVKDEKELDKKMWNTVHDCFSNVFDYWMR